MLLKMMVISLLVGAGATLINRIWDISFHAFIPASCAALLLPVSPTVAAVIIALGIAAGLARLPLKEHTVGQVLAGWSYGFGATGFLVLAMIGL